MTQTTEEWKPIVGFESFYEVSSHGGIRRTTIGKGTYSGRILKYGRDAGRYPDVVLYPGSKAGKKRFTVHSLVAEAFHGPRPLGMEINHLDGDKNNPRACNLEYITPRGNQLHSLQTGLRERRFADDEIRAIRAMMDHIGHKRAAKLLGVTPSSLRKIKHRKSYVWVE